MYAKLVTYLALFSCIIISTSYAVDSTIDNAPETKISIAELQYNISKGDAKSMYLLGLRYIEGIDFPHLLGPNYSNGIDISQNKIHAYMWLALAAQYGYSQAIVPRNEVEKTLTQAEIAATNQIAATIAQDIDALKYPTFLVSVKNGVRHDY